MSVKDRVGRRYNRVWLRTQFKRLRCWLAGRAVTHDDLYDAAYYQFMDREARKSAPTIAATIVRELHPRTLIDVGCGTGALLAAVRDLGIDVRGFEYSSAALQMCRERGLNVTPFDLEADSPATPETFDVATSLEVAEHLPERLADRFVDLVVSLAPTTVFTAATPGQGGQDHVNEQPHAYWIAKFVARGRIYDEPASLAWRKHFRESKTATWYAENLMLFRSPTAE